MRTPIRDERMDDRVILRCTPEDKKLIKQAARNEAMDMSAFLRAILIKQNVINP